MRAPVTMRVPLDMACLALTRATLLPRATARVMRPPVPPVPVVPVVAAMDGIAVRVPPLGAVATLPRVRGRRTILRRGAGRRARARGRLLRPGIMMMR